MSWPRASRPVSVGLKNRPSNRRHRPLRGRRVSADVGGSSYHPLATLSGRSGERNLLGGRSVIALDEGLGKVDRLLLRHRRADRQLTRPVLRLQRVDV